VKRLTAGVVVSLLADLVVLLVCALHLPALQDRSAAPFVVERDGHLLYVGEILDPAAAGDLRPGDVVLSWNGKPIPIPSAVEFLGDRGRIGDTVSIAVARDGTPFRLPVTLVPAHSGWYIGMVYLTGAVTLWIGIFVLLARPGNRVAAVMHGGLTAIAAVVVIAFENITASHLLGYLPALLFFAAYASVAAAFFLFATEFPRPSPWPFHLRAFLAGAPLAALAATCAFLHHRATVTGAVELYPPYRLWFDILRIAVVGFVVASAALLVRSFLTTPSPTERKKVQWILWGLLIGPLPFLLLTALPLAVAGAPLLPEDFTLLFFLNIPITFAVAFVRYRALDIDVVISRSTTYFIVLLLLGGLYAGTVAWVASAVTQTWASAAGAVAVALLFEPVRVSVQRFVDRRFFRAHYDERKAREELSERIRRAGDLRTLAEAVVTGIDELIPVERIAFAVVEHPRDRLRIVGHRNFELLEGRGLPYERGGIRTRLDRPQALARFVEAGTSMDEGDAAMFTRWKLAMVLPLASKGSRAEGFLALGPRKSGSRFSLEDVDLVRDTALKAGLAVDRIREHEKLILQELETERLRELNRLKTEFVGYVSHDLKTPLANIKMYAQLLNDDKHTPSRKRHEFLDTIEGESDRLTRMVDTILDSTMVEAGTMALNRRRADLGELADTALRICRYLLESHGVTTHWKKPARPVPADVDADKVCQALTNLIGNAVKYAREGKEITLTLRRSGETVRIGVADRGPGIPDDVLPHIFERYYRDPARSRTAKGAGLGLPLVREIMRLHGGTVDVETRPGRGSTFTLVFPAEKKNGDPAAHPGG
jgi:signal transduction histidine kinase